MSDAYCPKCGLRGLESQNAHAAFCLVNLADCARNKPSKSEMSESDATWIAEASKRICEKMERELGVKIVGESERERALRLDNELLYERNEQQARLIDKLSQERAAFEAELATEHSYSGEMREEFEDAQERIDALEAENKEMGLTLERYEHETETIEEMKEQLDEARAEILKLQTALEKIDAAPVSWSTFDMKTIARGALKGTAE
jgi:DNA repair exonuclease SbcCD ATPase subunit